MTNRVHLRDMSVNDYASDHHAKKHHSNLASTVCLFPDLDPVDA
jgi:hypothetical protein